MRSKANKCTLWLQGKPLHEQKRLVNFAISQAKDDRVRRCVLEKSVEGKIVKRRKELAEERAMKNRSAVIRQVRKALKVRCASDLKCEEPLKERVEHFIHHPESIIGTPFLHTTEDGSEFYGRIVQVEKGEELWIGYWGLEDSETGAVDHSLTCESFFTMLF